MIDTLPFASALVYAPRGKSAISLKSQTLRDRIKRADAKLLTDIADHVAVLIGGGAFPGFFGEDVTLVPVPGHAPLWTGAVGTTSRIADALRAFRDGSRPGTLMPRIARGYDESEIQVVSEYLAR